MAQTYFHAIDDDLLLILRDVEQKRSLKYIASGRFAHVGEIETYYGGDTIPNLGIATADSDVNCASYLVSERDKPFVPRDQYGAFWVDLRNDEDVEMYVGGLRAVGVALRCRIVAATDNPLIKAFRRALRKHFTSVRGICYVGPKAMALLRSGGRLTLAVESAPEFDLTL